MGLIKGGFLRLLQTALYFLAFCCSAIILGFFSYFLSVLADRDAVILTRWKAVEGLSGAATLYTIFAVILTCCLGGVGLFAFLGLFLDVLFIGAMVAIAILTRRGADSCQGYVYTPIGNGPADVGLGFDSVNGQDREITYSVKFGTACRFNKACFAVSIIGAFLFLVTALMQLALFRHHKKEKAYGPGPSNNYTSGFGRKKGGLFARNKKVNKDTEYAAGGLGVAHADTRPSHETGYTGTTMGGTAVHDDKLNAPAPLPTHGGYHTAPQGTGVNPYGYNNTTTTATNY